MNELQGRIIGIEVNGNLSLVVVEVLAGLSLQTIVIDTPETASYLKMNNQVLVVFKQTEVVIGVGEQLQISIENQIPARITQIEKGKLLCKLTLESKAGKLSSIISTAAAETLKLKQGDSVLAMVKLNEVMLRGL